MYENHPFESIVNRLDKLEENAEMSDKLDGIFYDEVLKLKADVEKIAEFLEEMKKEV